MNVLLTVCILFNRRRTASASRKGSVEVRIAYNYKQVYISTGISLQKKEWKNNRVVNRADAEVLNLQLNTLMTEIRGILLKMSQGGDIDITCVRNKLKERNCSTKSLYDFIQKRVDIRKYGKAEDTQERYDRFLRLFMQWGGIKSFSDITESNIMAYDEYLHSTGMRDVSKWNNYHRFLNSFINDAVYAGFVKSNPYKHITTTYLPLTDKFMLNFTSFDIVVSL